jgi:hypothetical protein
MYLIDDRDDMIDDELVVVVDDDSDDDDKSDLSILGASTATTEWNACSWNE